MTQGAQQGDVIGARYRLLRTLGTGGMGRVWEAHDGRLETRVALKELWLPPAMSPQERTERLKRAELEALNAARLRDHPNIVTVHDVLIEDGCPWIVMQLVSGGTLQERLTNGPVSVSAARKLAKSLLGALAAAHRQNIVHRDVKPANVMVTEDRQILLTDFGIAASEAGTGLTATGVVVGSAPYLAPERAKGETYGPASDLFSLGVTLFEALEGVSPFLRESSAASLHAVAYEEAPTMRRAGPLEPLIVALLAKSPADRPSVTEATATLKALQKKPAGQKTPTGTKEITAAQQPAKPAAKKSAPKPAKPAAEPAAKKAASKPASKPANPSAKKQPAKKQPAKSPASSGATPPGKPATAGAGSASSSSTSSDNSAGGCLLVVLAAIGLALLLYGQNEDFSRWVSHDMHGSASSPKVGDCLLYDTEQEDGDARAGSTGEWVKVPCWAAAAEYEVNGLYAPLSAAGTPTCTAGGMPVTLPGRTLCATRK
ncbi:serine/threonine protein kinase [Streptomyces oryzae]|uniref:non-specific serine/threonine protein kinase n=1 Tax=Streptomyces oryzae TaxID=1434886 RepID=A0ABS3XF70_9ACTN|nr:serine/threonine-protein kinase [Streptomyces oryzae]MBO8194043.1 serine/threonine protein kinase [Streptomyces oryzae]